jgi:opacity protein-like surface antigen
MFKKLAIFIVGIAFCGSAIGQDWNTMVTYNIGLPVGNTSDFIGETSFRGVMVAGDYFIEDEWTVGFTAGIQTFYEELGRNTYTEGTVTATGDEFRYLTSAPFLVTGKYHFDRFNPISAHVGVGAGLYHMVQTVEFAGLFFEDRNWQLGFMPEAGLGIEMSASTDFYIAAQYNYYLESKDILAQSYIAFNIGFRFKP